MIAEGPTFESMRNAARERLSSRTPEDIAARAGALFRKESASLEVQSLGQTLTVGWPDCELVPVVDGWRHLVLLHYMDLADGTPLLGREQPFAKMQNGMIRGGDFDRRAEVAICKLAEAPLERLRTACEELGASFPPSNADFCAVFPFLPRFPVTLRLWLADEEFDASGRLLIDASADHYLTIEDAVTVGELLLNELEKVLHKMQGTVNT